MKTVILLFFTLVGFLQGLAQNEFGCTDATASNYNVNATQDDGTCCYQRWVQVVVSSPCYLSFYSSEVGFIDGQVIEQSTHFCLPSTCLSANLHAYDTMTPFTYEVYDQTGNLLQSGVLFENDYAYFLLTPPGAVNGCADPQACNYDPTVFCSDYTTCDYACLGCTDASAPNFDPNATVNDGSCCSAENYIHFDLASVDGVETEWYIISSEGWSYVATGDTSFCLPDGCYTLYLYNAGLGQTGELDALITDFNGSILYSGLAAIQSPIPFSLQAISGCPDWSACNYNPQANCLSWESCDYSCIGCTNPAAPNYNPAASVDNGQCCTNTFVIESDDAFDWTIWSATTGYSLSGSYPAQSSFCLPDGCFQWTITVFNSFSADGLVSWTITNELTGEVLAIQQDQLWFSYNISNGGITGCVDPSACNYDANATCGNASECNYDCFGCTDVAASNYDSTATFNDGTCCYHAWCTVQMNQPGYWYAYNDVGGFSASGDLEVVNGFCMPDGCYSLVAYPLEPSPDFSVQIFQDGNLLASASYDPGYGGASVEWGVNPIIGCTETGACNYDPNANCQGTAWCSYDCYGCLDEAALNFDAEATIDNGSCCYNNWYYLEFTSPTQWSVYSNTTGNYQSGFYPGDAGFCMDSDCFELYAWSENALSDSCKIYNAQDSLVFSALISTYYYGVPVSLGGAIPGCGDPYACNFNPDANCYHYFDCDYGCYGCMNPDAANFDEDATQDDGSCCFDNGYTLASDGNLYWSVGNANGFYSAGITSDFPTFCSPDNCFFVYVTNYNTSTYSAQLIAADGTVLQEFVVDPFATEVIHVGTAGEIAGCMDANSCNFNPDATCDDGSCYLCFGCTDPSALNYDATAWIEDGSCMYELIPPMMGMMMLPDSAQNQFYVLANVMGLGNMPPYLLRNNFNNEETLVSETGQMMFGPFPCDASVEFTISSLEGNLMNVLQTTFDADCNAPLQVQNPQVEHELIIYPNPAQGEIQILHDLQYPRLTIYDQAGRSVFSVDQYSASTPLSLESLAPGLYEVILVSGEQRRHARFVVQ